jgi:hypothetical protein
MAGAGGMAEMSGMAGAPAAGDPPVVLDYAPDNGVAGDTIQIVGRNLAGATLIIKDAAGRTMKPGARGTTTWPDATSGFLESAETVDVVLPLSVATGPISVETSSGKTRGRVFNAGHNLTQLPGTILESSSEFDPAAFSRGAGADNNLRTSFFAGQGNCSAQSCASALWYQVTLADPQPVARIALRGNREYANEHDIKAVRVEVMGAAGEILWTTEAALPAPHRDADLTPPLPIPDARSIKIFSIDDDSETPGFSEVEIFGL